ncbi:MAG: glutamate 5-kinase, partial [Clostridia bacterium]|nr:glutamate 5-kinase [Clostridia bacterium]
IGDNDTLAAIVACSVKADKLILLSDIDGLYTADPHTDPQAKLIPFVYEIDEKLCSLAGGTASGQGTGGMVTKLQAAKICMECGCEMIITNGNHPEILYDILDGKTVGTTFTEKK